MEQYQPTGQKSREPDSKNVVVVIVILAVVLATIIFTGIAVLSLLKETGQGGASQSAVTRNYSDADYELAIALKQEDYESLTHTDYQNLILRTVNSDRYRRALDQLFSDSSVKDKADTDQDAYFLRYILHPMYFDNGSSYSYHFGIVLDHEWNGGRSEISLNIRQDILKPDEVTLGERDHNRQEAQDGLQDFLSGKKAEELDDYELMNNELIAFTETLSKELSGEGITIQFDTLNYWVEETGDSKETTGLVENSSDQSYTEDQYALILSARPDNYQELSVADFNAVISDLVGDEKTAFSKAMETVWVGKNEGDTFFIQKTLAASNVENTTDYWQKTYNTRRDPFISFWLKWGESGKSGEEGLGNNAVLSFSLNYRIDDKDAITVGERDGFFRMVERAAQESFDALSLEELRENDNLESLLQSQIEERIDDYNDNRIQVTGFDELYFNVFSDTGESY